MNPLMSQPCRIELLGCLRVHHAGRLLTRFPTYKTAALLASLAYQRQPQSRELLIERFWPDTTPERGRNNLSNSLSSLRNQLEPPGVPAGAVLIADRHQVSLNPASIHTDVQAFEHALQLAAAAQNDRQRAEHLQAAVDLYAGELLPGYYEDWIIPERRRLAEAYLQALRRLIRFLVRRKQPAQAIDYALRALAVDPLREETYRDLMKLYMAIGQPSVALQQYRQLEQSLHSSLNARPTAATRQVLREIEALLEQPAAPTNSTPPARPEPEQAAPRPALPGGTVTFLLTDIAGFTAQWERAGEPFRQALATHHALLRAQFARHGGQEFKEAGDAFLVAFARPSDALVCAIACQRALAEQRWPGEVDSLRVRMALHTGEATPEAGDYHSPTLNRASRMLSAAHGGQVLCSETTASLLRRDLTGGVDLHDLGLYRLRDLPTAEHLFQVEYPQMPQREFPAPNADAGFTSTLPLTFTRFFGRAREQERLQEWLLDAQTRLVTLTGIGGTGKTRLALEVARSLEEAFGGAVWFVALADIVSADLIVSTLAGALHLTPAPLGDLLDQVVAALSRRPSLLVLDNFEQLVEAGASLVQTLLNRVPSLSLLVTSRQTLELAGERDFALAPLPIPDGADTPEQLCLYESVQLFIDRAQTVKPDFQVTSQNAAAVATLCMRLEGIPLAIELAAARSQVLTPSQILAQLANRFDFLASRRRDLSERHRTLRAAMEWSYRLLSPELQRFFARLSVFRGGWTMEAAEAVCKAGESADAEAPDAGLALDYLAQLRECSLLQTVETEETIRFRMLETVREYAFEQLTSAERSDTGRRHADYYLAMAEQAQSYRKLAPEATWLERLEIEIDNLRSALAFYEAATDGEDPQVRLAIALERFWDVRCYWREGWEHLMRALRRPGRPQTSVEQARALIVAGRMAYQLVDNATGRALYEESLSISRELGDRMGIAEALCCLGDVAYCQSEYAPARELFAESLSISRELGDRVGVSSSLRMLGDVACTQGDNATARAMFEESLSISREMGDKRRIANALCGMGGVVCNEGNRAAARALYEESLAIRRELGDRQGIANILQAMTDVARDREEMWALGQERLNLYRELGSRSGIASALNDLGNVAHGQGDNVRARTLYEESVRIQREVGDLQGVACGFGNLGDVARDQGDYASAQALYEESLSIRRELDYPLSTVYSLHDLGNLACSQADYSTARSRIEESLGICRAVGNPHGIACSLRNLADVATAEGDYAVARSLYQESLSISKASADLAGIAMSFEGLAAALQGQTEMQESVRFWGATQMVREQIGWSVRPNEQEKHRRYEAQARAALGEEAFAAAREEGRAMSWEQAVALALEDMNA